MKRKVLVDLIIFVCFLSMISCGGNQQENSSQTGRSGMGGFASGAIPVRVDTVKIEPISSYILTNTTLEALRQVDIVARVSGIVQNFFFEDKISVIPFLINSAPIIFSSKDIL